MLLHSSFLIILGGAMLTFVYGEKGYVHLLQGQSTRAFQSDTDNRQLKLPFALRLDSFRVECYPGTEAPSDYVSTVTYTTDEGSFSKDISMNNILTIEGYRFYQSSFDEGNKGSWLSVNYDPIGIGVTYTGYLLLALSSVWLLLSRRETFRKLLANPLLRKGGLFVLMLLAVGTAGARTRAISEAEADKVSARQVIYQDRVVPFNTLARDFVLKLTGKPSYKRLTPEQVVCSWMIYPEDWQHEPMIYVKDKRLREKLHCEGKRIALADLFEGDTYKLERWLSEERKAQHGMPPKGGSKMEKAILELDEKVGLILMLREGTLIKPLPDDGSVERLSDAKVKAEILYNRIPFAKVLFMVNLTLGILSFGGFLYMALRRETDGRKHGVKRAYGVLSALLYLTTLFHWTGYFLRWYVGGRMPLSNGYETMLLLAGCILIFSCWLKRRFPFVLPFGFLLSGFALLVAYLGQMNPQITPLVPVLLSPWLSIHVSLIMIAYALYAYIFLNGILGLCLRRSPEKAERLMLFSKLMLYPATLFLGVGIFIGAVWANVSWGSYWSWDSKEVWALITFMVYGAAFHERSFAWLRTPRNYHLYMILAFLSVLMTYVGVNYFLVGMHSYA